MFARTKQGMFSAARNSVCSKKLLALPRAVAVLRSRSAYPNFSERRTAALVYKLEKYMMQLVQIMYEVVELTIRYENHRIGKDN